MMDFWYDTIVPALQNIVQDIIGILPSLAGALAILVIGWIIAKVVGSLVTKLLEKVGFNSVAENAGIDDFLKKSGIKQQVSWIVGRLAFWIIMLMFLLSAAETLQLKALANTIQMAVGYIPNLIVIIMVLVFGMLVSRLAGKLVAGMANSAGIDFHEFLGKLVTNFILAAIIVIAISQLEIKTAAIDYVFIATLLAIALAVALAVGLGAKQTAHEIINGIYARKIFEVGQNISVNGVEGEIMSIGTITTQVRTASGISTVPNKQLTEQSVDIKVETGE
jgi:small-conductance mechanosensitive channel